MAGIPGKVFERQDRTSVLMIDKTDMGVTIVATIPQIFPGSGKLNAGSEAPGARGIMRKVTLPTSIRPVFHPLDPSVAEMGGSPASAMLDKSTCDM